MCLLAINQLVPESPILVAANREDLDRRVSRQFSLESHVSCGIDRRAGGSWLGVNQHGLFVAACKPHQVDAAHRTAVKGCSLHDLLRVELAREAVDMALEELSTGSCSSIKYVIADAESGWVIHGCEEAEVVQLHEGLSIVSNGDVNDRRDERVQMAQRLLTLRH